uniref:RWD domain-containing protein n=2 Tax=Eutreptiella gymnastica TaxID=73025 RepID=A0A7S4LDR0_9EUGL
MAGQKCPLCNGASPTLYLVHHPSPGCSDFRSLCEDCEIWDNEWQFATNSRVVLELVDELRAARCRQCDAPSFPCSTDLQAHLKQKHKLQFCALCIEHRPLFMSERILYTAKELEMHNKLEGRCSKDPPQFRGHPECHFCQKRYYDVEALLQHLYADHLQCPLCSTGDQDPFLFYKDIRALADHCRGKHFLCEEEGCPVPVVQRVFDTQLDLRTHRSHYHQSAQSSRKGKSKAMSLGELGNQSARPTSVPATVDRSNDSSSIIIRFAHGGKRITESRDLAALPAAEPPPAPRPIAPPRPSAPPASPPAPKPKSSPAAAPSTRPTNATPKAKVKSSPQKPPLEAIPSSSQATVSSALVKLSDEQQDEADALKMIYDDQLVQSGSQFCVTIPMDPEADAASANGTFEFKFAFVQGYPQDRGPKMEIEAGWMNGSQSSLLEAELKKLVEESLGSPMLFTLIEWLKENAPKLVTYTPAAAAAQEQQQDMSPTSCAPDNRQFAHVQIHSGEPITDRKSKFQAFCAGVKSLDEVNYVIQTLRSDHRIASAAHPTIYAYRFVDSATGRLQEHRDDDGETGAADKLLYLVQVSDAKDVLIVVTRWYGGIHLGPDRFRHISTVAKELLQQQDYISQRGQDGGAGKAKGKSRK